MASHCDQRECGFSIYRGVLVQWDEDHDERVLDFLDQTPSYVLDSLLVVQEHEGNIAFVWKGAVPKGYEAGECRRQVCGDEWNIYTSTPLPLSPPKPHGR